MSRDEPWEEPAADDHAMLGVPLGYEWEVWPVNGVCEPELFYWKVWFEGEVVNGGIADDNWTAHHRIRHYRFLDVTKRFYWDRVSRTWVRK